MATGMATAMPMPMAVTLVRRVVLATATVTTAMTIAMKTIAEMTEIAIVLTATEQPPLILDRGEGLREILHQVVLQTQSMP